MMIEPQLEPWLSLKHPAGYQQLHGDTKCRNEDQSKPWSPEGESDQLSSQQDKIL